jgi:hypothetical protein
MCRNRAHYASLPSRRRRPGRRARSPSRRRNLATDLEGFVFVECAVNGTFTGRLHELRGSEARWWRRDRLRFEHVQFPLAVRALRTDSRRIAGVSAAPVGSSVDISRLARRSTSRKCWRLRVQCESLRGRHIGLPGHNLWFQPVHRWPHGTPPQENQTMFVLWRAALHFQNSAELGKRKNPREVSSDWQVARYDRDDARRLFGG